MSTAEIIAMVRDIVFLTLLTVMMAVTLMLYYKVSKIIKSGRSITESAQEVASTLSRSVIAMEQGAVFRAGKLATLLLWPVRTWLRLGATSLLAVIALALYKNWLGIRGSSDSSGLPTEPKQD